MAFKTKSVEHGTNRFSVRSFLAAILRPFMAYPTDACPVFSSGYCQIDAADWHTILRLGNTPASQCQLERMVYAKCTTGAEHEFLLLHFRHPTQHHAVAILVLDRTSLLTDSTENNNDSSESVGQASVVSPSVSPTSSRYAIFTIPNIGSAIKSYLASKYGPHKYLCNLKFSASACPLAIQVSVLLNVLSKHSPTYYLYQCQCHWYTYTVWEALKTLFPDCQETMQIEGRSPFCGEKIKEAESVEAACEQYRTEWTRIENAAEERRRAKEEEVRRFRMEHLAEGRAQRQSEIDELRRQREEIERKADEERRKADEVRKQREEAERKFNEVKRQWEEMKRKAGELGLHDCPD